MNPVLALGLAAVAGIAVLRLPRLAFAPPALDLLRTAGTAVVLLGMLLGPGIGVLDGPMQRGAAPVAALAVGWIGGLFGARFDRRLFQRLQTRVVRLALVQAVAAFTAVALGVRLLTQWFPGLGAAWAPTAPATLALAAIAAASGPGVFARLTDGTGARWPHVSAIGLAALLDTGLGVLAFTVTLAYTHPRPPGAGFGPALWLLLAAGSGVLVGLLFLSLSRVRHTPPDLTLFLFGCLLLGAGVGYSAGLTPFVVCAAAGVVIAGLSPHQREVLAVLETWERPVTIVLLVAAGAWLELPTLWIVPAALALGVLRIAARWAAVRFARGPIGATDLPPQAGLAGIAQGSVVIALGVSYVQEYGGGAVLATVVVGVALAQLAAPAAWSRGLRPAPLTPATPAPEVTA